MEPFYDGGLPILSNHKIPQILILTFSHRNLGTRKDVRTLAESENCAALHNDCDIRHKIDSDLQRTYTAATLICSYRRADRYEIAAHCRWEVTVCRNLIW